MMAIFFSRPLTLTINSLAIVSYSRWWLKRWVVDASASSMVGRGTVELRSVPRVVDDLVITETGVIRMQQCACRTPEKPSRCSDLDYGPLRHCRTRARASGSNKILDSLREAHLAEKYPVSVRGAPLPGGPALRTRLISVRRFGYRTITCRPGGFGNLSLAQRVSAFNPWLGATAEIP
jgi:hypothetical protein